MAGPRGIGTPTPVAASNAVASGAPAGLPLDRRPTLSHTRPVPACDRAEHTQSGRSNAGLTAGRVLLVDDEPKIGAFVARALAAVDFQTDVALTAREGLALALKRSYDLVILDLLMPGMSGVDMLRRLMEHRPDQQVLVLSCLTAPANKVECLHLGAADYLAKPFSLPELVARVEARVRASRQTPVVVVVGRVRLDLVRREADCGAGPVGLAEREFVLLHELLRAEGRPVTKEHLLSVVWHYDFDPGSNVVDVYVRRLRLKLGTDVIETVRGRGYRIDAG